MSRREATEEPPDRRPAGLRAPRRAGAAPNGGAGSLRGEGIRAPRRAEFLRSLLLYEDDEVFVFNKPAGLAVQGGSGLTRHLDAMLEALRDRKGQKPRLVHRLDRDTSGVWWSPARGSPRRSSRRPSARVRPGRSIGRWSRACRSRGRAASRRGSQAAGTRPRGCGSPGTAGRRQPRGFALFGGREGRPDARLAVDATGHRPHAPASGPRRPYRPSDHRRPEIFRRRGIGNCRAASRTSFIYMRGASSSRIRRAVPSM